MSTVTLLPGIDFVGVTTTFYCHDGLGNFVMSLRGKNARDEQGKWDPGGGKLDFGETVEKSLRREIEEEYCTKVLEHEFLGYRDVHRTQNGKSTHWISLDFSVLVDPKLVRNGEPNKLEEVRWFTFETLPENVHSQWPGFVERYRARLEQ